MANRGSLAYWKETVERAKKSFAEAQRKIAELKELYVEIATDMKRFEKDIEGGLNLNEVSEIITALMGFATDALLEEFAIAVEVTEGDINPGMLDNLLEVVSAKLIPKITFNDDKIEADLIASCNQYLGPVADWFDIVKQVRITRAPTAAARMIGWRQIFDAGVHGIAMGKSDVGKLAGQYESIMSSRLAMASDIAPYWHFLEYGNNRGRKGTLYPHPRYGAPKAVSKAEERVETEGAEKMLTVNKVFGKHRTKGWHERKKLLDKLGKAIEDIEDELEDERNQDDMDEMARRVRGIVTRAVKARIAEYHGMETLEQLSQEDAWEIRNKVIHRIVNYQQFTSQRIYHKGLRMKTTKIRLDVEVYMRNVGFGDVTLGEVFY